MLSVAPSSRPCHDDPVLTDPERAFLSEHRWGLLATTRRDNSPQVTMIAYSFDGTDFAVSCRWSSAKFLNARRVPAVVLAVPDERSFLSVAGSAECITADPERHELTRRVQSVLEGGDHAYIEQLITGGLDAAQRGIIRITPTSVRGRI